MSKCQNKLRLLIALWSNLLSKDFADVEHVADSGFDPNILTFQEYPSKLLKKIKVLCL